MLGIDSPCFSEQFVQYFHPAADLWMTMQMDSQQRITVHLPPYSYVSWFIKGPLTMTLRTYIIVTS